MPVNVKNNLSIENNVLDATYNELFTKLNVAYAWTNSTYTVYTTKTQTVGNNIYSDTDLTVYSQITEKSSTTITDQYRTYTRDSSKDSNFTAIPPETANETISTIDFLRITNPNG